MYWANDSELYLEWHNALRILPIQVLDEWSESNRVLTSGTSYRVGPWKNTKYQGGIQRMISDPNVQEFVLMKSGQVGATELSINFLLWLIERDPGPALVALPSRDLARGWMNERFTPAMKSCEAVKDLVHSKRGKEGQSNLQKFFAGGSITAISTASVNALSSRPARYLLLDEASRARATHEGDPVGLLRARAVTFPNYKMIMVSTPTIEGECIISREFEGTRRHYFLVPCPHCGYNQRLVFSNLVFDSSLLGKSDFWAEFQCEYCARLIEPKDKEDMVQAGDWVVVDGDEDRSMKRVGVHISSFYSSFYKWKDIAAAFLQARSRPEALQVVVNTLFGETFVLKASVFPEFAAGYREHAIPDDGALYAAVDVQADRLEVYIELATPDDECFGVKHSILLGDPTDWGVWEMLDNILLKEYWGRKVQVCFVDHGYLPDQVTRFCARRIRRRVFPSKGVGGQHKPLVKKGSRVGHFLKARLVLIGTDTAKDVLLQLMARETPGPGMQWFAPSRFSQEFMDQLLKSERRIRRTVNGRMVGVWKQEKRRNEALDLKVMTLAARRFFPPEMLRRRRK